MFGELLADWNDGFADHISLAPLFNALAGRRSDLVTKKNVVGKWGKGQPPLNDGFFRFQFKIKRNPALKQTGWAQ